MILCMWRKQQFFLMFWFNIELNCSLLQQPRLSAKNIVISWMNECQLLHNFLITVCCHQWRSCERNVNCCIKHFSAKDGRGGCWATCVAKLGLVTRSLRKRVCDEFIYLKIAWTFFARNSPKNEYSKDKKLSLVWWKPNFNLPLVFFIWH